MMHFNNGNIPFYNRAQWPMPQPRYKAPSKVVSIPVQFVGSEGSRSSSAMRIQKVLRGFLVRKIVRKIIDVKVELEEMEKKIRDPCSVERMRKEERERIRVGESIMSLLLRLDSVRVLRYSALRDCRKSLTNRAIALQDFVDQIQNQAVEVESLEDGGGGKIDALQNDGCVEMDALENGGMKIDALENGGVKMDALKNEGCVQMDTLENDEIDALKMDAPENGDALEDEGGEENDAFENDGWVKIGGLENDVVKMGTPESDGRGASLIEEVGENECEEHEEVEALRNEEMVEEEEEKEKEEEEGEGGTSLVEENCLVTEEEERENLEGERTEECEGNRVLLEKMMEDNEKMMEMMQQLFQRNEMQTKLLASLTQRVEQLERAFACDKLRRKKSHPKNGSI